VGYAFINFIDYRAIVPFFKEFNGQRWKNFNSEKVCAISYARIQVRHHLLPSHLFISSHPSPAARNYASLTTITDMHLVPCVSPSFSRHRASSR
jgi:hypothetical protein